LTVTAIAAGAWRVHHSGTDDEDITLALTVLADIRSDVRSILWELQGGEEEEEDHG
jgi:hypothetical protein